MFDEVTQQNSSQPTQNADTTNQAPVQDMFAEEDSPITNVMNNEENPTVSDGEEESDGKRKLLLIIVCVVGGLVVVAGIVFGVLFVLNKSKTETPITLPVVQTTPEQKDSSEISGQDVVVPDSTESPATDAQPPQEGSSPDSTSTQIPPSDATPPATSQAAQDSDGDGLMNEEEKALGTDPKNPDSDNDGLTDREEVRVYRTDALKDDTDGDTYKDGAEVQNQFNPNGPGKLIQLPQ